MVELKFESLEATGMPSDCYVSVRIGEQQKFSRLSERRVFKFTQAAKEGRTSRYGKIEVFRRIGACGLDVDPSSGPLREVNVNCSEAGFGNVAMRVALDRLDKAAALDCGSSSVALTSGPTTEPATVAAARDDGMPQVRTSRGQQAKDYLREHCLEVCLSDAVQAVLRERPADPIGMLIQKLQAASRARILHRDDAIENSEIAEQAEPPAKTSFSAPATQSLEEAKVTASSKEQPSPSPPEEQLQQQLELAQQEAPPDQQQQQQQQEEIKQEQSAAPEEQPPPQQQQLQTEQSQPPEEEEQAAQAKACSSAAAVPEDLRIEEETRAVARSLVVSARSGHLAALLKELNPQAPPEGCNRPVVGVSGPSTAEVWNT
mmetsp:Transcript_63565/g.151619  ORF Transcript_63565/g.151619 Transcript_63565/m.151619 type:complete len:374 (+) Transcript_63565:115-1236(+)